MAQGRLTVLHVITEETERIADEEQVREYLERTYASQTKVEHEIVVARGDAAEQIIRLSEEKKADMIVMGARGMGRLSGLLGPGSVAEKVTATSKVPVLLVPKHEYEDYRDRVREQLARRKGIPLRTDIGRVLKGMAAEQEREQKG
jgi:nucleotide-binding universal stress UspA family protein